MKSERKTSEVIREICDIFDYFEFHNKNLTKKQEYKIVELKNLIHELKITLES